MAARCRDPLFAASLASVFFHQAKSITVKRSSTTSWESGLSVYFFCKTAATRRPEFAVPRLCAVAVVMTIWLAMSTSAGVTKGLGRSPESITSRPTFDRFAFANHTFGAMVAALQVPQRTFAAVQLQPAASRLPPKRIELKSIAAADILASSRPTKTLASVAFGRDTTVRTVPRVAGWRQIRAAGSVLVPTVDVGQLPDPPVRKPEVPEAFAKEARYSKTRRRASKIRLRRRPAAAATEPVAQPSAAASRWKQRALSIDF